MTIALLLTAAYLLLPPQRILTRRNVNASTVAASQDSTSACDGQTKSGVHRVVNVVKQRVHQHLLRWRKKLVGREISVGELLHAAAACDLLAACLRSGLPVGAATKATAAGCHPTLAPAFEACASRFALGAGDQWRGLVSVPVLADVAISAQRVNDSGAALAKTLHDAAANYRNQALDAAAATAERAGVSIAGPLALCFLPAFVVLGLIPTIAGLASEMFIGWVS